MFYTCARIHQESFDTNVSVRSQGQSIYYTADSFMYLLGLVAKPCLAYFNLCGLGFKQKRQLDVSWQRSDDLG